MMSRFRAVAVLCVAAISLFAQSALARNTYSGLVLDCNNQPVPNVHVSVAIRLGATCGNNNYNNSIIGCVTTNAQGRWVYYQNSPSGGTWSVNWCFNTYGMPGSCENNSIPCCNELVCIGGGTSFTSPNLDLQEYSNLDIHLNYEGACPGGGGGGGDPDPKLPNP